jgi:hypothetical protein
MEGAFVKADERENEDLVVGDWAGAGRESIPDLAGGTPFVKGQQGIRSSRRSLKDDVELCTIKKVETISCPQQSICGWLRYVG